MLGHSEFGAVKGAIDDARLGSPTMAGLVREGKLKIVYAMHAVASGKVAWFG